MKPRLCPLSCDLYRNKLRSVHIEGKLRNNNGCLVGSSVTREARKEDYRTFLLCLFSGYLSLYKGTVSNKALSALAAFQYCRLPQVVFLTENNWKRRICVYHIMIQFSVPTYEMYWICHCESRICSVFHNKRVFVIYLVIIRNRWLWGIIKCFSVAGPVCRRTVNPVHFHL